MTRYAIDPSTEFRRCTVVGCRGVARFRTGRRGRPPEMCSACSFKQRRKGRALPKREVYHPPVALRIVSPTEPVPDELVALAPLLRGEDKHRRQVRPVGRGACEVAGCGAVDVWLYWLLEKETEERYEPLKKCSSCVSHEALL